MLPKERNWNKMKQVFDNLLYIKNYKRRLSVRITVKINNKAGNK